MTDVAPGYAARPMGLFPTTFLEDLRAKGDPSRWPGLLARDPSLHDRVVRAVEALPADVAAAVATRLTSERKSDPHVGRALLWCATVARAAGAEPVAIVDDGALRVSLPDGGAALIVPAVFHMDRDARGAPDVLARLVATLESGFAGRRFALAVRRPVPADFDADAVARAVTLWVRAVERGDWRGRHAVYDDERLSIELTLLEAGRREAGDGLTFLVGPSVSLDRLSAVDGHLQGVVRRFGAHGLPLVAALVGEPRWGVSRGYASQLLYGTPDEVRADNDGATATWRAAYHAGGSGLFADAPFRLLASLWWLEPDPADALGVCGWSHENPWRQSPVPAFPGSRCAPIDEADAPRRPDRVWMAWTSRAPTALGGPT